MAHDSSKFFKLHLNPKYKQRTIHAENVPLFDIQLFRINLYSATKQQNTKVDETSKVGSNPRGDAREFWILDSRFSILDWALPRRHYL